MGLKNQKSGKDSAENDFLHILRTLKDIMRNQGLSYKDLANILGLSESGVKKIFYAEDCSFRRLSQIAKALNCQLIDIMDQIDRAKTRTVQFSPEQQNYFLKNPKAFHFFINLVVERQKLESIQTHSNLTDAQTFAILKKLDDLKLIKLMPNNRVKLPPLSQVVHFGTGPLLEQSYRRWSHEMVETLARPQHQKSHNFIIRGYSLREESYKELTQRLADLDQEFLRRTIREMSTFSEELKPIRWVSMIDQNSLTSGPL